MADPLDTARERITWLRGNRKARSPLLYFGSTGDLRQGI